MHPMVLFFVFYVFPILGFLPTDIPDKQDICLLNEVLAALYYHCKIIYQKISV